MPVAIPNIPLVSVHMPLVDPAFLSRERKLKIALEKRSLHVSPVGLSRYCGQPVRIQNPEEDESTKHASGLLAAYYLNAKSRQQDDHSCNDVVAHHAQCHCPLRNTETTPHVNKSPKPNCQQKQIRLPPLPVAHSSRRGHRSGTLQKYGRLWGWRFLSAH